MLLANWLQHKEFGHIGDRLEKEAEEEQNGPDHTHLLGGISSPFKLRSDTDHETEGESAKDRRANQAHQTLVS